MSRERDGDERTNHGFARLSRPSVGREARPNLQTGESPTYGRGLLVGDDGTVASSSHVWLAEAGCTQRITGFPRLVRPWPNILHFEQDLFASGRQN